MELLTALLWLVLLQVLTPLPMLSQVAYLNSQLMQAQAQKQNATSRFTPVAINTVGQTILNNMQTTIKDSSDLLSFLVTQSDSRKDWFGFTAQKLTAISLAHEIAANHADKFTPDEIVNYVFTLNNSLYQKIIKPV